MARRRATEDVSKLPQWAQRRIEMLEASLASAHEEALSAATAGASNTQIHDYAKLPNESLRGLPSFTRVRFGSADEWIEAFVVKGEGEGLKVELYSGTDSLVVHPKVSNVVYVGVRGR